MAVLRTLLSYISLILTGLFSLGLLLLTGLVLGYMFGRWALAPMTGIAVLVTAIRALRDSLPND